VSSRLVKLAKVSVISKVKNRPTDDNHYAQLLSELKSEFGKRSPVVDHLKQLVSTFDRRRQWIDSTPSDKLTMSTIFDKFPCFRIGELLIHELLLIKGTEIVSRFEGLNLSISCIYLVIIAFNTLFIF